MSEMKTLNGYEIADGEARKRLTNSTTPEVFGAIGDGETDDTEAICAAIAFLSERGGGVLRLGLKTYLITPDRIAIPSHIYVEGGGATIKTHAKAPYIYMISADKETEDVIIKNIIFDQSEDEVNITSGSPTCAAIWGNNSDGVTVDGCYFVGAYGINTVMLQSYNRVNKKAVVINNRIEWCRRVNDDYDVSCFYVEAQECQVARNTIIVNRGVHNKWKAATGIEVHAETATIEDNSITGNKCGIIFLSMSEKDVTNGSVAICRNVINDAVKGIDIWGRSLKLAPKTVKNLLISDNRISLSASQFDDIAYIPIMAISFWYGLTKIGDETDIETTFDGIYIERNAVNLSNENDTALSLTYKNEFAGCFLFGGNSVKNFKNVYIRSNQVTGFHAAVVSFSNKLGNNDNIVVSGNSFTDCSYSSPTVSDNAWKMDLQVMSHFIFCGGTNILIENNTLRRVSQNPKFALFFNSTDPNAFNGFICRNNIFGEGVYEAIRIYDPLMLENMDIDFSYTSKRRKTTAEDSTIGGMYRVGDIIIDEMSKPYMCIRTANRKKYANVYAVRSYDYVFYCTDFTNVEVGDVITAHGQNFTIVYLDPSNNHIYVLEKIDETLSGASLLTGIEGEIKSLFVS